MTNHVEMVPVSDWFEDLRREAAHAWALELNELAPIVRGATIAAALEAERRAAWRLIYGVDPVVRIDWSEPAT